MTRAREVIGWREWISLPDLGIGNIKAKIDTGARTSSLHAFDVERFSRGGSPWVRFDVHPLQRDSSTTVSCEAQMIDERVVKNPGGRQELRPVIATMIELGGTRWKAEITLTRRDTMGFRMLLGRQTVRKRFVVDPGSSFIVSHKELT